MKKITVLFVMLAAMILSACSGIKTYPEMPNKNVHIQTKLTGRVSADMSIHSVDVKCETKYLGTVDLDEATKIIGITPNQLTYLYVVFERSGFLGASAGSTSYSTLFRPRSGNEYRIDLRYKDDIYNVDLFETLPGKKTGKELEQRSFDECKKM